MAIPLFNVGGFSIYLFGVTVAIGIAAGYYISSKEVKRKGLEEERVSEFLIYSIIVGIIGGRLGYVFIYNPSYYLRNPFEILKIHDGGMSIHGSLLAGILFAIWYVKKYSLDFWKIADATAPGLAIGQAIGRIGCDVFGYPMARPWPWGVLINGQLLHPAQVYEFLLDYIMFLVLWRYKDRIKYNGQLFIIYLIFFNINRAIVEFFRENPMVFPPFSVAHLMSAFFIILALLLFKHIKKHNIIGFNEYVKKEKKGYVDVIIVVILMVISTAFYYYIH